MSRQFSVHQSKRQATRRPNSGVPQISHQRGGPNDGAVANFCPYRTDPVCVICSTETATVRHIHASSEYDRRMAVKAGKNTFYCISCGRNHETAKPTRRRLLLTSSTLYRFDKAPGWSNNSGHFDVEAIVGGTVNDRHEMFQLMYGPEPEPVDAVLVLGINNVLKNHSTE